MGGYNNNYEVPDLPYHAPSLMESSVDFDSSLDVDTPHEAHTPRDFDEDTEVESIAAVESIADTASEADTNDAKSFGEPELIDVEDVIHDPDYPGTKDHFLTQVQNGARDVASLTVDDIKKSSLHSLSVPAICPIILLCSYFFFFSIHIPRVFPFVLARNPY